MRALEPAVALGRPDHQLACEALPAMRADEVDGLSAIHGKGFMPRTAASHASGYSAPIWTDSIRTSSSGLSRASLGTREMSSTTSIPEVIRPNTVCLP